jgi:thiamine-phosphate pyrophosphorylase
MPAPRLYLITPPLSDSTAFAATFESALITGDIACVLFQGPDLEGAIVRRFVPMAQRRGIACLVPDARLAAATDCDGVHIDGVGPALEAALAAMKPQRIVGAGGINSRHDAMSAAEAGVDYVMFGGACEQRDFAEIRERAAWWAEIFNVPCVAYAQSLDETAELAHVGADFVALCDAIWDDVRGPLVALEAARRAIAGCEATA